MKYTIEGFSQEYAMTLKNEVEQNGKTVIRKIDCTDLVILRWFVDFYPRMKKVEVDGRQYAFLSHKKLLEDLPLIDISKKSFIERMKKLVEFDLLSYKFIKENGSISLYGFGENYIHLVDRVSVQTGTGCTVEQTGGIRSNGYGVVGQTDTINNSIINISIKNNSIKYIYNDEFEELWQLYPRKVGKTNALKAYIKARKNGTTFEEVKQGIENYRRQIEAKGTATEYIKHGSTWFNQESWNDEYTATPSGKKPPQVTEKTAEDINKMFGAISYDDI